MQTNTLKRNTPHTETTRIGRGGKRGKTSGRGMKGQNARAGHKKRPELRDIIKKLPKLRGHGKNRSRTVRTDRLAYVPINLSALELAYTQGESVTPATLYKKGLAPTRAGKIRAIKILGTGTLTKNLLVSGVLASETAKKAIEKAGGSIIHNA